MNLSVTPGSSHVLMPPKDICASASRMHLSPETIAHHAVQALIDEATLTPKPALVDRRGCGAHLDLSLDRMLSSAYILGPYFVSMARTAQRPELGTPLREALGSIGRDAERAMLVTTGGTNTHRGAIWALGLLVAAIAHAKELTEEEIRRFAAELAALPDRTVPASVSNGADVQKRYGVGGARSEAMSGFPHLFCVGLPALRAARSRGRRETHARLDALLSIMTSLEDTCLLHRGGHNALDAAQRGAARVLADGGSGTLEGSVALQCLHESLMSLWASPGGAADMLAATLLIDRISRVPGGAR